MIQFVGIAGGSGSGKSTLAKELHRQLAPEAVIIPHDNYYRRLDNLSFAERCQVNFDHPDALESGLLGQHLFELRLGRSIEMPLYCFETHTRRNVGQPVEPVRFVIVEGVLVLVDDRVSSKMDLKIFVDAPCEVRYARRRQRDMQVRGRTDESVAQQWSESVQPMFHAYVAPSKSKADMVVSGDGTDIRRVVSTASEVIKQLKMNAS